MIKDWKLVYSPKNEVLETLLTGAATSLGLKGVYGVAGQKELEATMVNKQLVAGVQFEHSPVSTHEYFFRIFFFVKTTVDLFEIILFCTESDRAAEKFDVFIALSS